MARETAAERRAREMRENVEMTAQQAAQYPAKLLSVMERAQAVNFELDVKSNTFQLQDRDEEHRYRDVYAMTYTYSDTSWDMLHSLERDVERKEEAEREEVRRAQVRANALMKLTAEERELLNV